MHNQRKVPLEPLHVKRYPQTDEFRNVPPIIEPVDRGENAYGPDGYRQSFDSTMFPHTSNEYVAYNDPTQLSTYTRDLAMLPQHDEPQGYQPDTHLSYYHPFPPAPRPWHSEEHHVESQDSFSYQGTSFYTKDSEFYHHDQYYAYEGAKTYPTYEWQLHEEGAPSGSMLRSGAEKDTYFCETGGVELLSATEMNQDQAYHPASALERGADAFTSTQGNDSILAPPTLSSSRYVPQSRASHYTHNQSVSQIRKNFRYSDSDTPVPKERSGHSALDPKVVKTTVRVPASTGAILATSGNSLKRERDANYSRHAAETPSVGTAPAAVHSAPTFPISSSAPLLRVPTDLPVSTTSFLDLIANFVVQGGPTFEEELLFRERSNPHFDFLRAPWNDPRVLYYRWRLYSLLQGDNMLEWRTEPFQIERSGAKAYVWVPPPAIVAGPACLKKAFESLPRDTKSRSKTTSSQSPRTTGETDGEEGTREGGELPPASVMWLSRQTVREGRVFVTLSEEDEKKWRQLLNVETLLPTEVVAAMKNTNENSMCASLSVPLGATPSPHSSKSMKADSTPVNSSNWVGIIQSTQKSLLNSDVIAERMIFAVEHTYAALHVWSILLDKIVALAYECAGEAQKERFSLINRTVETSTGKHENTYPNLKKSCEQPELPQSGCGNAIRMHIACFQLLFYLFIVHDTIQNADAEALTDEEAAEYSSYHDSSLVHFQDSLVPGLTESDAKNTGLHQKTVAGGVCSSSSSLPPGSSSLQQTSTPLHIPSNTKLTSTTQSTSHSLTQEVKAILPTLIEATLLVAFTALDYFSKRLEKNRGVETTRKNNSSNNSGCCKESKEGAVSHEDITRSKTLKAGLNIQSEDVNTVATHFPHLATVLATSTTQGGGSAQGKSGSSILHPVLHEEFTRVAMMVPREIRDCIPNVEHMASGEEEIKKQSEKEDATSKGTCEVNDMDDAAGVVRARLLLVWLRQLLCWWLRHTPETFWFKNNNGEVAYWSNAKCKTNKLDGESKEQEMSVVLDTTVLPMQNGIIRGRAAALLAERYGFLLNNAYL